MIAPKTADVVVFCSSAMEEATIFALKNTWRFSLSAVIMAGFKSTNAGLKSVLEAVAMYWDCKYPLYTYSR